MKLKCKIFGCSNKPTNFEYPTGNKLPTRVCKSCGRRFVYVRFWPQHDPLWLDAEYFERWGTYENLCAQRGICECCDRPMDKNGECGCNAC